MMTAEKGVDPPSPGRSDPTGASGVPVVERVQSTKLAFRL